ncbi:MAG: hypothetical protein LIP10_03635 [Clostridiales bacterium]|nr:hypothetical protein [Clostridiales bacterium]
MADVKKCDRCGTIYDPQASKSIYEPRMALVENFHEHANPSFMVTYDFCPECEEKLKQWLNEHKNKENQEEK